MLPSTHFHPKSHNKCQILNLEISGASFSLAPSLSQSWSIGKGLTNMTQMIWISEICGNQLWPNDPKVPCHVASIFAWHPVRHGSPLDHHSWGPPDVLTRGCEESGTIGAGPLVSTLDTPKKNWMFPPPKMNESNLKMDGKLGVWKMIFSENPGGKRYSQVNHVDLLRFRILRTICHSSSPPGLMRELCAQGPPPSQQNSDMTPEFWSRLEDATKTQRKSRNYAKEPTSCSSGAWHNFRIATNLKCWEMPLQSLQKEPKDFLDHQNLSDLSLQKGAPTR